MGTDVDHNVLAAALRREIVNLKLPLDDYLDTIESEVLQNKIEAQFTESLPAQSEQVNLLSFRLGPSRTQSSPGRASMPASPSPRSPPSTPRIRARAMAGAFGWAPRELLDPELADVAFSLTGRSGIIETKKDFYIIEVLGKETRDITPQMKTDIGENGFRDLLEQTFTDTAFAYNLTQAQLTRLAGKIQAALSGA
jgi:hypothetical protein